MGGERRKNLPKRGKQPTRKHVKSWQLRKRRSETTGRIVRMARVNGGVDEREKGYLVGEKSVGGGKRVIKDEDEKEKNCLPIVKE